ncbi:MAG TPA: SH3 domain-containing protein [Polyangiaceae bacterium]|nr:SH3 domain-containing protein [Polyangiaceae bacterium]
MTAGSIRCRAGVAAAALALAAGSASAQSPVQLDQELDTVARVTSSSSELRAGPGLSYRVIERAERGDTFFVQGREQTGYWLRVYLPDGRTAYLLGDTADTLLLSDAGSDAPGAPGVFAPPPLGSAHGGLAMTGGIFDGDGYAELKPAIVVTRALSLEPYVGLVMSSSGRSLLYGGGATVNLAPDFALAPYLSLGGGGFSTLPNDDAFVLRRETLFHARAGGGLLVSLRWRITLRLEATNTVLFNASAYRNAQSFVGGLGSYF